MKKFLSLVLALVMTMSLVTVANAAGFTDDSKVNYDEAVDVVAALEIVGGYADGSFNPTGTLTRGAAAKIICNLILTPEVAAVLSADAAPFKDVPADHTFAAYIAYCAQEGIISGYADGTFRPAGTLTGNAFMKMVLGALGYDATAEKLTGDNWTIKLAQLVKKLDLAKGTTFVGSKAITREEACLYVFNALNTKTVYYYGGTGSTITINGIVISESAGDAYENTTMLFEENFKGVLAKDTSVSDDAFGRPAHAWTLTKNKKTTTIGTYADTATLVLENALSAKELATALEDADLKLATGVSITTVNGANVEIFDTNKDKEITASEIVKMPVGELVTVGTIGADKKTTKGDDRSIMVGTHKIVADKKTVAGDQVANFEELYASLKKDDKVVIVVSKGAVQSVEIPETVTVKVTDVSGAKVTAGGETYLLNDGVAAPSVSKVAQKIVALNGIIYECTAADGAAKEVIYLDTAYDAKDKYGTSTWYGQVVTAEGEVKELTLDQTYPQGFYTFKLNDKDQYVLTAETLSTTAAAITDKDVKIGSQYFAADVTFVYIKDSAAKIAVTAEEGVQNVTAGKVMGFVYDTKAAEITTVFVKGEYEAGAVESEDLVFVTDTASQGTALNNKDEEAVKYSFYEAGEKETAIFKKGTTVAKGFYTYAVDATTGEYKLTSTKATEVLNVAVDDTVIAKDKYITAGGLTDVTLDGVIYDLTDNGLDTLAEIAAWDKNEEALKISFVYDGQDKVVTLIYVEKA